MTRESFYSLNFLSHPPGDFKWASYHRFVHFHCKVLSVLWFDFSAPAQWFLEIQSLGAHQQKGPWF